MWKLHNSRYLFQEVRRWSSAHQESFIILLLVNCWLLLTTIVKRMLHCIVCCSSSFLRYLCRCMSIMLNICSCIVFLRWTLSYKFLCIHLGILILANWSKMMIHNHVRILIIYFWCWILRYVMWTLHKLIIESSI